jgi:hypothetical protein
MKTIRLSACGWLAAALLTACAGEARYGGTVAVTTPDLVEVDPGVQVVADANQPLFFADGYYWLYSDGAWLRSDNYRGHFARVDINVVPQHIRGIQRPQDYAHFNHTQRGRELARGQIQNNRAPERMNQPEARQIDRRDLNRDDMNRDKNLDRDQQLNRDNQNREDMNREDIKRDDTKRDDMNREDLKRQEPNRDDKAAPVEKTPEKTAPAEKAQRPDKADKTDKRDKRDEH